MPFNKLIEIDGSQGEGGGQIVRTSLSLSMISGRPFRIHNLRAGRNKPGLLNQHLTAVKAAQRISSARVSGMELGSLQLEFEPQSINAGIYEFDIGTAGSTTLVLQTILPALFLSSLANKNSSVRLTGGTHNPMAPTAEFLKRTFLPIINKQGPNVEIEVSRFGFFPRGGGRLDINIEPTQRLAPLFIGERREIKQISASSLVANLPESIGVRELATMKKLLGNLSLCDVVSTGHSAGPGNAVFIHVETDFLTETFSAIGSRGRKAELVASEASEAALAYLAGRAHVGTHLADQLLIPFALAGAGEFVTMPLSEHTLTNIATVKKFLDIEIEIEHLEDGLEKISFQS